MIYFIQPENGGLIKIGYTSKEPESRLRELQTGCHEKLIILATEEGSEVDESNLHLQFKSLRVRGEWFRPSVELLTRIADGQRPRTDRQYAIHVRENGSVGWCGTVVGKDETHVEIDAVDAICLMAGMWQNSGEVYRERIDECRFFLTKADAANATHRANDFLRAQHRRN